MLFIESAGKTRRPASKWQSPPRIRPTLAPRESSKGKVNRRFPWLENCSFVDSKQNSEYFDPCQEAASRSLKCLHRNGGSREMCLDYFQ
jgi:hypothetical protein